MEEVVYSADSQLRAPRRFAAATWSDLRASPPLAWRLFLHTLRTNYRQSLLGYVWLLLPPLATTATWVYLNGARVIDVAPTEVPYAVYVLTGTLLWQVFAEALQSPLQQLSASRNILTKSRVPHEAFLLAGLAGVLFNLAVRFAVAVPVMLWFGVPLRASALLAPAGVASLLLLGFSIGLLLTPTGLLYQDVSRGLTLLVGFWFFLTPVIYTATESWAASVPARLNPVTPLLVTTRGWLTRGAAEPAPAFLPVLGLSLLCLGAAWLCYRLARPHLVARL